MGNADSASAAFGLLLGLLVHNGSIVANAEAAPAGPVVAIEKANAAAAAESRRGHESDAEAARIFAPPGDSAAPAWCRSRCRPSAGSRRRRRRAATS
jgi:hypothetical protein